MPSSIRSYTETPIVVDAVDWCRAQLSARELDFVRTFVPELTLPLGGDATLFCYHGTPRSHMEDLPPTATPDELDVLLDGRAARRDGGRAHASADAAAASRHAHRQPGLGGDAVSRGADRHAADDPAARRVRDRRGQRGAPEARAAVETALRDQAASCDFPLRDWLVAQYA